MKNTFKTLLLSAAFVSSTFGADAAAPTPDKPPVGAKVSRNGFLSFFRGLKELDLSAFSNVTSIEEGNVIQVQGGDGVWRAYPSHRVAHVQGPDGTWKAYPCDLVEYVQGDDGKCHTALKK